MSRAIAHRFPRHCWPACRPALAPPTRAPVPRRTFCDCLSLCWTRPSWGALAQQPEMPACNMLQGPLHTRGACKVAGRGGALLPQPGPGAGRAMIQLPCLRRRAQHPQPGAMQEEVSYGGRWDWEGGSRLASAEPKAGAGCQGAPGCQGAWTLFAGEGAWRGPPPRAQTRAGRARICQPQGCNGVYTSACPPLRPALDSGIVPAKPYPRRNGAHPRLRGAGADRGASRCLSAVDAREGGAAYGDAARHLRSGCSGQLLAP
jgi:hypothetical protein